MSIEIKIMKDWGMWIHSQHNMQCTNHKFSFFHGFWVWNIKYKFMSIIYFNLTHIIFWIHFSHFFNDKNTLLWSHARDCSYFVPSNKRLIMWMWSVDRIRMSTLSWDSRMLHSYLNCHTYASLKIWVWSKNLSFHIHETTSYRYNFLAQVSFPKTRMELLSY